MATAPDTKAPRPVAAILWMFLTGVLFVGVTAIVKHVGDSIPPTQSAFIRYLFGLLFFIPLLGQIRATPVDRGEIRLFVIRGVLHAMGVALWFFAMTRIPLAEVTAMSYIAPIFVTIGAVLFLGERLAIRRIAAVIAALLGAIIVLRPGVREIDAGHFAMIVNALLFGTSYLIAKVMADRMPPAVVVAWLSLIVTLALFPLALVNWVWPSLTDTAWLFLVAAFATMGHFTMTLALRAAPITVTQPVTFLQLVWATVLGAVAFDEGVDIFVIAGGALILGSVTFITWREAVLKRRSITPPSVATKF